MQAVEIDRAADIGSISRIIGGVFSIYRYCRRKSLTDWCTSETLDSDALTSGSKTL